MNKKQSKDQSLNHQESTVIYLENSLNSDQYIASPPKSQPQSLQNDEPQFVYERQAEENHVEIPELKQNVNVANQNRQDFTNPVQYESGVYQEEKHYYQRETVQKELQQEKQLSRNRHRMIKQKDQLISAFQEERRLFENEHKKKNDHLEKQRKELEAEKEKFANQCAAMEKEKRQEKRQERQRQESNSNTLSIICSQFGQAIIGAIERYSQTFEKDEAERIFSKLNQQMRPTEQIILQVNSVNHYLDQSLQVLTKIVIEKHKEKQSFFNYRLSGMQQSHKEALERQGEDHLQKLDQVRSQIQRQQQELKQKALDIQALTKKLEESQATIQQNIEISRQQNQQRLNKITYLQTIIERQKADNLRKLEQIRSQSEQKYHILAQKAQDEIKQLSLRQSASHTSLEEDLKELKKQQLEKENTISELRFALTTKQEQINQFQKINKSLQLESQKLQAFKRQNQATQSEYRKLQAQLIKDFEKQTKEIKKSIKDNNYENERKLGDLKYNLQKQSTAAQQLLKKQIKDLEKQISICKEKEQNHLDDILNINIKFQEKQKNREIYKTEFQRKIAQVIESIVKDQSAQSQTNRQIFLQTTKDLQDKLDQQCRDKQHLCKNYTKLYEKYNELSKQHFLQSLKLQETTQSLLQSQLKEQICTKETTQLRRVLQQIQDLHRNVVQEIQTSFDKKLSATIEETSQFYQIILNSKEKIYEADLSKLQQELQSLSLIKNIKEKLSGDSERKLQEQRQDLKSKIKTMQREHNFALKANKNEIATLTESNHFLKKSLELSSQTLQAKQRILQSLQGQKALFRKTINFIHNQLDEKLLEQILEELDHSHDTYNQEVIDMVNGIFFSVNGASVQNKRLEQLNLRLTQEKENLGYTLKQIKGNAEDKDRKLESIQKKAAQTLKYKEKIKTLEAELKSANDKIEDYLRGSNRAQESARKYQQDLESIRSSERQSTKEIEKLKKILEQATRTKDNLQKTFSEKENRLQGQINVLKQKIETSIRERTLSNKEMENSMKREIEQLKTKVSAEAIRFTRLQQSTQGLNNDIQKLLAEKSTLERTIADLKRENSQLVEANRQKAREQEPVRRLVTSPYSRDSQKLIQYEQKANQLESELTSIKTELKVAKADLTQAKKTINKLLDEINELKRDKEDEQTSVQRKTSWNEQEQLVRGYQQISIDLREQNNLLQQEIDRLKTKLKRYEIKGQRSPQKE